MQASIKESEEKGQDHRDKRRLKHCRPTKADAFAAPSDVSSQRAERLRREQQEREKVFQ
jgi:hypothetical protein